MSNDRSGDNAVIGKAAGFVVFSGIALSIMKSLNPFKNPNFKSSEVKDPIELVQSLSSPQPQPQPQPLIIKKPITSFGQKQQNLRKTSVDVAKGDTLWSLSRKYGVSIEEIKAANELTGDTIYVGKKLVIP